MRASLFLFLALTLAMAGAVGCKKGEEKKAAKPAKTVKAEGPSPVASAVQQPAPASKEKAAEEAPAKEKPAEAAPAAEEKPAVDSSADKEKAVEEPAAKEKLAEKAPGMEKAAEKAAAVEEKPIETAPATEKKPPKETPTEEKSAEETPTEEKPAESAPAGDVVAQPKGSVDAGPSEQKVDEKHFGREFTLPAVMLVSDVVKYPEHYATFESIKLRSTILDVKGDKLLLGYDTNDGLYVVCARPAKELPKREWTVGKSLYVEGKLVQEKWDVADFRKLDKEPIPARGYVLTIEAGQFD